MASASIRTANGPVGLRPRREKMVMKVDGVEKRVDKDWLKETQDYHKAILQAMLVGSIDVALMDAADPFNQKYRPDDVVRFTDRRAKLVAGMEKVDSKGTKKKKLAKIDRRDERRRDVLVKFSKNMCPQFMNRRERSFIIENGELLVYKGLSSHAKLKAQYRLKDAEVNLEKRAEHQYPSWDGEHKFRLRVDTRERKEEKKNPIYLYPRLEDYEKSDWKTADLKVKRWKNAFQLAKVLTSQNDRTALRTCIGRAVSGTLIKGWNALFSYAREVQSTKATVKQMAMRLMRVEISRGYTKLRMAYREYQQAQEFRREQQLWAARFMSEKLAHLGSQNAKSAMDVRESVITRIQQRFRRYRDDRIFERTYPLSSTDLVSKTQQAKLGQAADMVISSHSCIEALQMSFPVGSEESRRSTEMSSLFKSKKPSYSEVNLPLSTTHVYVSDNLTSLSFSGEAGQNDGHDALSKASWSNFIHLDRISSVVLFSEPVPGAQLRDEKSKDGKDAGVWFTINGPRLSWGKTVNPENKEVCGVGDGLEVPEKLAKKGQQVRWQEFSVDVQSAVLNVTLKEAPKTEFKVVAHVLGFAFTGMAKNVGDGGIEEGTTLQFGVKKDIGVPVEGSSLVFQVCFENVNEQAFRTVVDRIDWTRIFLDVIAKAIQEKVGAPVTAQHIQVELLPDVVGFKVKITPPDTTTATRAKENLGDDLTQMLSDRLNNIEVPKEGGDPVTINAITNIQGKSVTAVYTLPPTVQDFACAHLEKNEVSVEIYQICKFTEDLPTGEKIERVETELLVTGRQLLPQVLGFEDGKLPETFAEDYKPAAFELPVAEPFENADTKSEAKSTLTIQIIPSGKAKLVAAPKFLTGGGAAGGGVPISPEFVGGGVATALFTSHRGAWYDATLGGKFRSDHVASFVEISLQALRLPKDSGDKKYPDNVTTNHGKKYRVKASCCGFSASSPYLTRPKEEWARVIATQSVDSSSITQLLKFLGHRLYLPLPPGCWCADAPKERRTVFIEILRLDETTPEGNADFNFQQFTSGQTLTPAVEKVIYETSIVFDSVLVDIVKPVSAYLAVHDPKKKTQAQVNALDNTMFPTQDKKVQVTDGVLNMDFALRDRDYVKAVTGGCPPKDMDHNNVIEKRSLCVGDKAMLIVEEPITYPKMTREAEEVKITFAPGHAGFAVDDNTSKVVAVESIGQAKRLGVQIGWMVKAVAGRPYQKGAVDYVQKTSPTAYEVAFSQDPDQYSKREFRKRFYPVTENKNCFYPDDQKDPREDGWDRALADQGGEKNRWPKRDAKKDKSGKTSIAARPAGYCDLRPPGLSSEYAESGLGTLVPKKPFKQTFIPNFCADIFPHEFILPVTEKAFMNMHLPGVYSKIVDAFAKGETRDEEATRRSSGVRRHVVNRLSHLTRKVPVTLLAVYSDGTCDVEIFPEFMKSWKHEGYRRYAMPGKMTPSKRSRNVAELGRYLLKKVPMAQLHAVHGASFNIYDATFWKTDDVLEKDPPKGGFDPRMVELEQALGIQKKKNTNERFSLAAGPLPADVANGACEYEWSVRLRAASEEEMYKFVANLRRCVRISDFTSASKMLEYQNRMVQETPQLSNPAQQRRIVGGQLDVLLVEARRLKPLPWQLNRPEVLLDDGYIELEGTTASGKACKATPKGNTLIETYVNFRMRHGPGNRTVIPYKGQKVQQSGKVAGTDSPNWAQQEEYRSAGGCIFRTGVIDPERYPDLLLDLEVMQTGSWSPFPSRIGAMQIPVTKRRFLVDPDEPFKNLWIPLVSVEKGALVPNKTGELHIMCRWIPGDKISMGPSSHLTQQVSVKQTWLKELWPRICAQRLREPIYNLEVQYLHYNPNVVKTGAPELPKDHIQRHAEELYNAVNYLECLERRSEAAWSEFMQNIDSMERVRIGELRQKWMDEENTDKLDELMELIKGGIPSSQRAEKWAELTGANRVMEREGLGGSRAGQEPQLGVQVWETEYNNLLRKGLPQRTDAMMQLQEDAFHMSSWESTVPPIPELLDMHLKRIRSAQNVCTALISTQEDNSGIVYSESLLILAFFLLLPQGCKDKRLQEDNDLYYMSESQAFWLLYTMICTKTNGSYKEYYGTPAEAGPEPQALVASSGAMQDVALLECCVAYHIPEVWDRMNAVGFQLATVFYGAFMRLFATYMPTSTVFRFWDILFAESTNTKAHPHGRSYLLSLAFGVLKSKRTQIVTCESAMEIRDLILGVLGSIYDMCTVVDITMMADTFLWGGAGYGSGKVFGYFHDRAEMFRHPDHTTQKQNEVLRQIGHIKPLGRIKSASQFQSENPGITTMDLHNEIIPVMVNALEKYIHHGGQDNRRKDQAKHWFMHRPMPLCSKLLGESAADQAWTLLHKSLQLQQNKPHLPRMVEPGKEIKGQAQLEPWGITQHDLQEVFSRDIPNWGEFGDAIWRSFNDRQDIAMGMMGHYNEVHEGHHDDVSFKAIWNKLIGNSPAPTNDSNDLYKNADGTYQGGIREFISIKELCASLICASKGTVGEKAAALFHMFAYTEEGRKADSLYHQQPVSKLAKSLTITSDVNNASDKNEKPPDRDSEDAKRNALVFTVYSNYPQKDTELGWVYIPTLGPYISYDASEAESHHFNIWGRPATSSAKPKYAFGDTKADDVVKNADGFLFRFDKKLDSYLQQNNNASQKGKEETIEQEFKQAINQQQSQNPNFFQYFQQCSVKASQRRSGKQEWEVLVSGPEAALLNFHVSVKEVNLLGQKSKPEPKPKLKCIGDLEMSICWTPNTISKPEIGQLMIHMQSAKFFKMHVSDYYKMNPWVTVVSHKKQKQGDVDVYVEQQIQRWDPRGLVSRDGQRGMFSYGAYGGTMKFEQTMRDNMIGKQGQGFSQHMRGGEGGFYRKEGEKDESWNWAEVWGKQYSNQNMQLDKEFVQMSNKKNVIDIQAVRLLVQMILQRSKLQLTNRQAVCIADAAFNRNSVVPGILEAALVNCSASMLGTHKTLADVKAAGIASTDITKQMVIEHEKQIALNGGFINLFEAKYVETIKSSVTLESLGIKDPYTLKDKSIWLRYVRGGDGERCLEVIEVTTFGKVGVRRSASAQDSQAVSLDADPPAATTDDIIVPNEVQMEKKDVFPSTKIMKEEFVSCFLNSPILSESMRRMGNVFGMHTGTSKKAISFEVLIMDPHHEEEDDHFMEAINIGQSVLFEVWDSDIMGKDFLGEAWLPPLASMNPRFKDLVLPLQKASYEEDAENGPSRDDPAKEIKESEKNNKEITGEVYVSVSWKYPAFVEVEEVDDSGEARTVVKEINDDGEAGEATRVVDRESLKNRAQVQEKLHTGLLSIKINKAKNLRRADASKGRACDPQVIVWVRNDSNGMWRAKPLARTPVKTNTRNPEWNFASNAELVTGDFEARFPPLEDGFFAEVKTTFRTARQHKNQQAMRDVLAVKRFGEGCRLRFVGETMQQMGSTMSLGPPSAPQQKNDDPNGTNHKVEVFLGDSIWEFKHKVMQACSEEADYWKATKGDSSAEARQYDNITISYNHLVMVFVGSSEVQKLHNQKLHTSEQYRIAYETAEHDPSCWQPLDPARTFAQYPQYGFGKGRQHKIRIVEASEAYKRQNLRYKQFDKEMSIKGPVDIDDERRCFAWAKYMHKGDAQADKDDGKKTTLAAEWRPCYAMPVAMPPEDGATSTRAGKKNADGKSTDTQFMIKMLHEVDEQQPTGSAASDTAVRHLLKLPPQEAPSSDSTKKPATAPGLPLYYYQDKRDVMLKPRTPLLASPLPEHIELLEAQAEMLRKYGKSDFEIATTLQKSLKDQWNSRANAKEDDKEPPPITVDVVRSFLNWKEAKAAKEKDIADKAKAKGK